MKMHKLGALLAAAVALSTTLIAAPTSHAAGCGAMETVALKTFHLVVKGQDKVYEVGETAKVVITVTRPAHEDPAGLGIYQEPPESFPAENVRYARASCLAFHRLVSQLTCIFQKQRSRLIDNMHIIGFPLEARESCSPNICVRGHYG